MATLTSSYQYLGRSSGMINRGGSYYYYILLYAKISAQALSSGYHTVTVKEVLACSANSSFYQYASEFNGKVDGSTAFSGTNQPWAAWELGSFTAGSYTYKKGTVIGTGNVTVDCRDGLAHDVALSAYWKMTGASSADYTPATGTSRTVAVTATLPAIPRASTVTATDANIGSTSTITMNRLNSGFVHTLKYKAAGQTSFTTIITKTPAASYGWTVPASLYALIPNDKTISVTISCDTYASNSATSSMGTTTCTMTASTSAATCAPTVTVVAVDSNTNTTALTGDNKKIVKGFSNIAVTTTAAANNSATISNIAVSCGSLRGTGADCTLLGADSATVKSTATDSRGWATTATAPGLTLIDYIPLTINAEIARSSPTSDTVTISASGNYFNGTFGATANTLEVKVRFKLADGSYGGYTSFTPTISGNTFTASGTISGLSYTNAYDVQVRAYDQIYGNFVVSKSFTYRVPKGEPVFDWGEDDFAFHVPVTVPGGSVPGAFTQGTKIWTGEAEFACTAANTVTKYTVTFPTGLFTDIPRVVITPWTSVPNIVSFGVTEVTSSDFKIAQYRGNTTATRFLIIAIGV